MSSSLCKASVYKVYQDVINDVISNTREHFMEDGVDEAVLQELKQLWQTKLTATKAVEENKELDKVIGVNPKVPKSEITNGSNHPRNIPMPLSHQVQMPNHQHQMLNKQVVGQVSPNNHMPLGRLGPALPEWTPIPVQLTLPSAPGMGEGPRTLSIDVPEVFLQGPHLQSILTGQVISTTMGLPLHTACTFLQDHVNAAFVKHQHHIPQGDGPADSSDEDEQSEERSENDTDEDKDDDLEDNGPDDDPLNSGDDVSDADGAEESFETDNVIVCQYDKITRSRNRWKFHLKDGIMNLKGQDYIFQKANGDAEW